MPKSSKSIPENTWSAMFSGGIVFARESFDGLPDNKEVEQSHRDDWHLFILQEKGTTSIEIDFQKHEIKASSLIYIHPNQVHRVIAFKNAVISSWAINTEKLKPEYLNLLEGITPAKVLPLDKETFSLISENVSLGLKYSERKYEVLYNSLLKDSCNTLVALVTSQYLAQSGSGEKFSRFEVITKAFKSVLEQNFAIVKNPMAYADNLNISTPYLNECVKNTTGHSVSYHIQHRIILEARRLLYHSDKSIKEIAAELGYDDSSYFSRLFTKITGVTPLVFRNKNLD